MRRRRLAFNRGTTDTGSAEAGESALLSAIASDPIARVRAELGNLFRLALLHGWFSRYSEGVTNTHPLDFRNSMIFTNPSHRLSSQALG